MKKVIRIEEIDTPEVQIYCERSEVRLRRYYEPQEGIFICESGKVITRALEAGYEPLSFFIDEERLKELEGTVPPDFDGPVFTARKEVMSQISGYQLTGGILSSLRRIPLQDPKELCAGKRRIAVLEDVENPTNLGAIFRSAAALGIEAVLLTSDCTDPLYRRASRVSMGTVFQIPWTRIDRKDYMDTLHALGMKTAAMALTDDSVSIRDPRLKAEPRLSILLGNEGNGLSEDTLKKSDYVVKIPMREGIDSLNVAAASAVVFWEVGETALCGEGS